MCNNNKHFIPVTRWDQTTFPALTLSASGFPLISGYRLVKTIKMATDKACPHFTGLIYYSVSN